MFPNKSPSNNNNNEQNTNGSAGSPRLQQMGSVQQLGQQEQRLSQQRLSQQRLSRQRLSQQRNQIRESQRSSQRWYSTQDSFLQIADQVS